MHRLKINWQKNNNIDVEGTIENEIFTSTQKLISIRKNIEAFGDYKNITWLLPHNIHVAAFVRGYQNQKIFCRLISMIQLLI